MRKSRRIHKKKYAWIGYDEDKVEEELNKLRAQLASVQAVKEQEAERFRELFEEKRLFQNQLLAQLDDSVAEERRLSGHGEPYDSA